MAALTAKDVMATDVTCVADDTTIGELVDKLRSTRFSGFPVLNGNRRAIGLVSQNDVLRALACLQGQQDLDQTFQQERRKAAVFLADGQDLNVSASELLKRPVTDIMTPRIIGCRPDTALGDVCSLMVENRIHRVVVVDGDGFVEGLIAATDLVRSYGSQLSA